jgi:hypothetical protein
MKGALVRGIDPALEGAVTDLAATNDRDAQALVPGEFRRGAGRRAGARSWACARAMW